MDHNLDAEEPDMEIITDNSDQSIIEDSLDTSCLPDEPIAADQFEKILALFFLKMQALDEFHLLMTVNIEFQWYQRLDAISTKIIKRFEKVRSSHNENGSSLEQYFNLLDTENPTSFSRGKALISISILLGEKISQFSRIFEDGTSTAALRTSDPMNGATIAVINSDKPRFFILAENEIVQDNLRTFEEAIMYVFVYHYILNLQFCAPYMLEFCQRAIVQAGWSDNHNSKISRRVNSLIKILDL
uniref:Uncharacterized protein n=1 Tax=Romanomermis culicivorax TaxID=13658 RepID=A0A915IPS6_ROMCU